MQSVSLIAQRLHESERARSRSAPLLPKVVIGQGNRSRLAREGSQAGNPITNHTDVVSIGDGQHKATKAGDDQGSESQGNNTGVQMIIGKRLNSQVGKGKDREPDIRDTDLEITSKSLDLGRLAIFSTDGTVDLADPMDPDVDQAYQDVVAADIDVVPADIDGVPADIDVASTQEVVVSTTSDVGLVNPKAHQAGGIINIANRGAATLTKDVTIRDEGPGENGDSGIGENTRCFNISVIEEEEDTVGATTLAALEPSIILEERNGQDETTSGAVAVPREHEEGEDIYTLREVDLYPRHSSEWHRLAKSRDAFLEDILALTMQSKNMEGGEESRKLMSTKKAYEITNFLFGDLMGSKMVMRVKELGRYYTPKGESFDGRAAEHAERVALDKKQPTQVRKLFSLFAKAQRSKPKCAYLGGLKEICAHLELLEEYDALLQAVRDGVRELTALLEAVGPTTRQGVSWATPVSRYLGEMVGMSGAQFQNACRRAQGVKSLKEHFGQGVICVIPPGGMSRCVRYSRRILDANTLGRLQKWGKGQMEEIYPIFRKHGDVLVPICAFLDTHVYVPVTDDVWWAESSKNSNFAGIKYSKQSGLEKPMLQLLEEAVMVREVGEESAGAEEGEIEEDEEVDREEESGRGRNK